MQAVLEDLCQRGDNYWMNERGDASAER
jgi:hypothetical protein